MQKKLITLAIAGALAIPGAAMADVSSKSGGDITIYGKFHASWDYVKNDATVDSTGIATGGDDSDDNTAVFRNARLGFKGSEDLGSGMKGIWQVETDLQTADDSVGLRNTFIGLQGDNWGTVIFGKHDTPYKTATAKLDIFSDTIADYNNIIGAHLGGEITSGLTAGVPPYSTGNFDANKSIQSSFNERPAQTVAYETPNFNGFKAQLARVSYQNNEKKGGEELEAWSAMGMYDQGPFFASLAYEQHSGGSESSLTTVTGATPNLNTSTNDANSKIDAWKLGLGYSFGDTQVGFVYEDIEHDKNNTANNMKSRDAFWAGVSHKFGANVVKFAYGKADDSDANNNNDGADNWSIGIDHNFSKRTKVYAIYTDMNNDTNANYGLNKEDGAGSYAPGINTVGAANTGYSNLGSDVSAFSVGIVHSF